MSVAVAADVRDKYDELVAKNSKYIICQIVGTEITVQRVGGSDASYDEFLGNFGSTECSYGIYDFDGTPALISWIPDDALMKDKMLQTTGSQSLRRILLESGLNKFIQATEQEQLAEEAIRNQLG